MSAKYSRVIIDDINCEGFTEDEISSLVDLFCRLVGKLESVLAKRAEFELCDFASTKNSNLKSLKLVMTATIENGNKLWSGIFSDQKRSANIIGAIDPF